MKESKQIKLAIKELEKEYERVVVEEAIEDKVDLRKFIESVASDIFEESVEDIKSKKRNTELLQPRSFCYYVYKKHTKDSLSSIGNRFNRRSHATIKNSIDKVEVDMMTSPVYRAKMQTGMNIVDAFIKQREADV